MTEHRPDRVADTVRRHLARALQEQVRDPRIGFVTLTEVRLSADLRHAVIYFTMLGGSDHRESLHALNRAVPFLRRSLARAAALRFIPELRFVYDESLDAGLRLDCILERLRDERGPADRGAADPPSRDEDAEP